MIPTVAIVGRPNVGKSTLFNRLVGGRTALVANEPGMTRDRHYGKAQIEGSPWIVIDTGGFESGTSSGTLEASMRHQAELAIGEAQVVVIVFDVRQGLTPDDQELVEALRRHEPRVTLLFVANKADSPKQTAELGEFFRTGAKEVIPLSAEHGLGIGELSEAIDAQRPAESPRETPLGEDAMIRIALVGRPNAGKSALLNRITGTKRAIVSDLPGTTRDPINVETRIDGKYYHFVDTAGIRRKQRSGPAAERLAVLHALRNITEADVAILLIDGSQDIAVQDIKIASTIYEEGRACIVAFSKDDLWRRERARGKALLQEWRDKAPFAQHAPHATFSSVTGKGISKLLPLAHTVYRQWSHRVPTAQLNRFLEEILGTHSPPTHRGRAVKIYYITQVAVRPPRFVLVSNQPKAVSTSYRRFVANRLRDAFGFSGTPIQLFVRQRKSRSNKR